VLRAGYAYERATKWHTRRPTLSAGTAVPKISINSIPSEPPDIDQSTISLVQAMASRARLKLTPSQFAELCHSAPHVLAMVERIRKYRDASDEAALGISLGMTSTAPVAQTFPVKPVRLIVAQSAGGGADATARLVSSDVSTGLGRQLIVENRAGGGGRIGAEYVAKAAPDGYTLLFVTATFPVSASVFTDLSYDPVKDFTSITLLVRTPSLLAVHPSLPARSVSDLIALARRNPGKINYAGGIGSTLQLFMELFKLAAKVDLLHVPYNGTGPALIGVLSGEAAVILAPGVLVPYVKSDKLRVLAIASAQRSAALPDLPQ